jgi:hypothetical protein
MISDVTEDFSVVVVIFPPLQNNQKQNFLHLKSKQSVQSHHQTVQQLCKKNKLFSCQRKPARPFNLVYYLQQRKKVHSSHKVVLNFGNENKMIAA